MKALMRARTAVIAPKTMPTQEASINAPRKTQIPREQIARFNNFTLNRSSLYYFIFTTAAPAEIYLEALIT